MDYYLLSLHLSDEQNSLRFHASKEKGNCTHFVVGLRMGGNAHPRGPVPGLRVGTVMFIPA